MSGFTPSEMHDRLTRIRANLAADGLDACVVNDAANVRYATGFRGEPRTLLVTADAVVLYTSFRTRACAQDQTQAYGIELSDADDPLADIADRLSGHSHLSLGTDHGVTHQRLLQLRSRLDREAVGPCDGVERARWRKSEREIELLVASQQRNEAVLESVLPQLRPGMTEREAQGLILATIARDTALDGYAFTPIVAAGANAWEIHHLPDATPLTPGELIILDLGVVYQGYASDMTRTVCLGQPSPAMREVYDTVGRAQRAALEALRPGNTTRQADAAAREVLCDAGYGRGFTHGLGHSIGLQVHDPLLNLAPHAEEIPLEAGMAFTLEPGAYLEARFGVRTEDTVVVREDGPQNLTRWPHELAVLPA